MTHRHTSSFHRAVALAIALGAATVSSAHADAAIDQAKVLLASKNRDDVEAGIQSLGLVGTAGAVEPLVDRIHAGLPPDLLDTAIITLMALGQPSSAQVLFELSAHRRPEVRVRAIEAIVAVAPKDASSVLRSRLGDQDAKVRSAAAIALGELNATDSVDALFLALDRGNLDASQALGKLLPAAQVPKLLGYLGKVPFRSMAPGLGEVLLRKDVSERDKLNLVARIQEVGTPEAKTYLGDFLRQNSDKISQPVSRAILQAMQGIAS
jgi:HEAT repeat protein